MAELKAALLASLVASCGPSVPAQLTHNQAPSPQAENEPKACPVGGTPVSIVAGKRDGDEIFDVARELGTTKMSWSGDLNQDGQQDLVLRFYEDCGNWGHCPYGVYVGCGEDRYVPVWGPGHGSQDGYASGLEVTFERSSGWSDLKLIQRVTTNDDDYAVASTLRFSDSSYEEVVGSERRITKGPSPRVPRLEPELGVPPPQRRVFRACQRSIVIDLPEVTETGGIAATISFPSNTDVPSTTVTFADKQIGCDVFRIVSEQIPQLKDQRFAMAQLFCENGEDAFQRDLVTALVFVGDTRHPSDVLWTGQGYYENSNGECEEVEVPYFERTGATSIVVKRWTQVFAHTADARRSTGGKCQAVAEKRVVIKTLTVPERPDRDPC